MKSEVQDTHQKALQVNLDAALYGTFAEIGAGQEVARWFFRVGGAAGTIAKAMSAYDMTFSDAIYGPCERYVSRQRITSMLDHEFRLLFERLDGKRGDKTRFFVFANTVAARSYSRKDDAHGWLGIRFQTEPQTDPSQIIIHLRLLDKENLQQQEALGIVGVNLVHGAAYLHANPEALVVSLIDSLNRQRIEVDMIEFSGPDFQAVDNRLMSLRLVQHGLTEAAMFTAAGEVIQPADSLYKKSILVERGSFKPVTNTTVDMMKCAQAMFIQEPRVNRDGIVPLMEMTLNSLTEGSDKIDHQDFLDRVDLLGALGRTVLISNFGEYHRLASYLFRYTKQMIGIVMGVPTLKEIFDEKYYTDLEGGILESFGRLFKNELKLYAYPTLDSSGSLITAGNLRVAPHLRHLYQYLVENRLIESIRDYDETCLPIRARDVLEQIRKGDPGWQRLVPPAVGDLIKRRRLLGYAEKSTRKRSSARTQRAGLVDSVHLAGVPNAA